MKARCSYLLICGILLGALSVAGYYIWDLMAAGPICYRNFYRIQEGMTLAEVEGLLGCRPGNYATGRLYMKVRQNDGTIFYAPMTTLAIGSEEINDSALGAWHRWHGDRGTITVTVDGMGRAIRADYCEGQPLPSNWRLALERKLGLTR